MAVIRTAQQQQRGFSFAPPQATEPVRPTLASPPEEEGGFMSAFADKFRRVVPKRARDIAGGAIQTALSGERAVNLLTPGDMGTDALNQVRRIPGVGNFAAEVIDTVASPLTLATLGFGPALSTAVKAGRLGMAGKIGGAILSPAASGTLGERLAAEAGMAGLGNAANEVAEKAGADPFVAGLAGLVGGATGARVGRGFTKGGFKGIEDLGKPQAIVRAKDSFAKAGFADLSVVSRRLNGFSAYTQADLLEAQTGLVKMATGQHPTPKELATMEKALGSSVKDAAKHLDRPGIGQLALDMLGVPRSLMTSADLSAPFRQGAVLGGRKEFWGAMKPMIKAFMHEADAKAVDTAIRRRTVTMDAYNRGVLHLDDFDHNTPGLAKKAEGFMSRLASEHIPLVRRSERAYVTFLNKLRSDTMENTVAGWGGKGTIDDIDSMGRWLNTATGRGGLGPNEFLAHTDKLMFAPRLWWSRAEILSGKGYLDATPLVRKEVRNDMVKFFGAGMTALTMAKAAGEIDGSPIDVELDPRSSDFGKIQIGDTRIDGWAGFQPIARYMAQMTTGEKKTSTGVTDVDRGTTAGRFVLSKMAPVPSFLYEALSGKSFIGEEVDVTQSEGLGEAAMARLLPLFLQDLADGIREGGIGAGLMTLPAGLGVGVQTYSSVGDIRNDGAEEIFGKTWGELNGQEQLQVEAAKAEKLARQKPPTAGSIGEFLEVEADNLRKFEQEANVVRQQGGDPRKFTEVMSDRIAEKSHRIDAVMSRENPSADTYARQVTDKFFALRADATKGGITDYEQLEQLEQNHLAKLSSGDRAIIEERRKFLHDPSVQWWVDAKQTIANAGYWSAQNTAREKLAPMIANIAPGLETYNQLVMAANDPSRPPAERRRIEAAVKRVDKLAGTAKEQMRRKDAALDKALTDVYGYKPLNPENKRAARQT